MYKRNLYLNKIQPYLNKPIIKVITGMRRVGKSYMIKMIMEELKNQNIQPKNILYINKESLEFDFLANYKDLYNYVKQHFKDIEGNRYLFVDEIQEINEWERAITSFFAEEGIDIYITGSNAHLLSSDIATLISGRYIEIPVYALGYEEFLFFRGKKHSEDEFSTFLSVGGFPAIHHFDFDQEVIYQYVNSLYNTILLKDVIKRHNIRNVSLLENICQYVFKNIGSIFTAKKVSDYMKSQRIRVGVETVQNYISYLESTFVIHKVRRYDIKGKRLLEFHEKYYMGDLSMRHAMFGYRRDDIADILENLVFLELKRRGYQVFIGKVENREVDFIAEKENRKIYIQVSYLLSSPETIQREFSALSAIQDNYPKYVISLDSVFGSDFEGIQRINLMDFLLSGNLI